MLRKSSRSLLKASSDSAADPSVALSWAVPLALSALAASLGAAGGETVCSSDSLAIVVSGIFKIPFWIELLQSQNGRVDLHSNAGHQVILAAPGQLGEHNFLRGWRSVVR